MVMVMGSGDFSCTASHFLFNFFIMKDINQIISDLSINIACLLDEPSEVTKQDLIDMQDLITDLENKFES